uniref:IMD domain-containing protein n=1 Tax=Oryctolagus cuniculus TaxID=9986 RepID=A0A5F9DL61_RABIT
MAATLQAGSRLQETSGLWGSSSPGDVLFQMAEVHRQIQNQLEDMVSPLIILLRISTRPQLETPHLRFTDPRA